MQVDFGEAGAGKHALLVDVTATTPAQVRAVPLTAGSELRTVTANLAELEAMAGTDFGDTWLRVRVDDAARAGIVEDVRSWLGDRVVEVRVLGAGRTAIRSVERQGSTPHELFDEYLRAEGVEDARLTGLFADLLDAETNA